MRQRWVVAAALVVVGVPLIGATVVMATRVGATARFVTWPVVGFTALAAAVALVGVGLGVRQPWQLVGGLLPAMMLCYVLPAFPMPVVVLVLVGVGALAVAVRGVAAGLAAGTGLLMVLFVALQGPAVTCHDNGVSSDSGPWWLRSASSSSGSGSTVSGGGSQGTTQVGGHRYAYRCDDGRLTMFERVDA